MPALFDVSRQIVWGWDGWFDWFEAPPLRLAVHTAPYFHDGAVTTLEEAVRLMARYELGAELDAGSVDEIALFLRAAGDLDSRPWTLGPARPRDQDFYSGSVR